MSPIITSIAWVVVLISLIDGFLISGRDSMIYLGLSFAAGGLFIISGILGGIVNLATIEVSALYFGLGWIAVSVVEVYGVKVEKKQ